MTHHINTNFHHARLLRAVSQRVAQQIIPQLQSPESVEDMAFARMVLDYLAGDLDVAPELLAALREPYRDAIDSALTALPEMAAAGYRLELAAMASEDGVSAQREVAALRDLAGRLIRVLSDATQADPGLAVEVQIAKLGQLDFEWLKRFQAAQQARQKDGGGAVGAAAAANHDGSLTLDSVSKYLRSAFHQSPGITATAVDVVPGGKSKRTVALAVDGTNELPSQLIMRQDLVMKYVARGVINEVAPLQQLHALGFPVPEPLYVERDSSALGGPFYLMQRLPGSPIGDFFGPSKKCPNAVAEIARAFARLHSLEPSAVGLVVTDPDPRKLVHARIEDYWKTWRENTTRGSALVDFAYAWARRVIAKPYQGRPVIVHGDAGGFNWLVDNDRLSAILDWEFMHVGDPAEDLGVIRPFAEVAMPWEQFMAIYKEAGGPDVDEERIELSDLLQWLKGTTLVAMSARNYVEGATQDYMKGVNSFAGLRKIEMKIADSLSRHMRS